jgi:hypothetical protein
VQLVVSSSVSMLVPLTIGKLIDFFSSNQVSHVDPGGQLADCNRFRQPSSVFPSPSLLLC